MIGSSVNLRFQQLQTSDTSSKGSSQQLLLPASNAMSAKQKCSVPRCQQPSWSLWKRRSSTLLIVVVEWLINIFLKAHSNLVNRRTLARPTNVFHSIHRPYSAIKCLTSAIKSWSSFLSLKSENQIILPEKICLQCHHCAVIGLAVEKNPSGGSVFISHFFQHPNETVENLLDIFPSACAASLSA